jgi:hypothetical protein
VLLRVTELAPSSAAQQRARVLVLDAVPPAGELLVSAPVAVQVAQLVSPSRLALPSSVAVVARLAVCGLLAFSPVLLRQPGVTLSPELGF